MCGANWKILKKCAESDNEDKITPPKQPSLTTVPKKSKGIYSAAHETFTHTRHYHHNLCTCISYLTKARTCTAVVEVNNDFPLR